MYTTKPSILPNPSVDDYSYSTVRIDSSLILIATQDTRLRTFLGRGIEREGYQVVEASTGKQCLETYVQACPDLVLLDACVSDMDGFTCCGELRALSDCPPAPILMMLSVGDSDAAARMLAAGAVDCVMKPVQLGLWLHRIRHCLRQSQLTKYVRQLNSNLEAQVRQRTAQFQEQATQLESTLHLEAMLQRLADKVSDSGDISQILQTLVEEFSLVWAHIAELEILNRHKDDFLSTVSHELRNPIYNMRLIAEILDQSLRKGMTAREKVVPLNSDFTTCTSYLKILQDECEQIAVLIDDLLALQRLEAEKQQLELAPILLQNLIPQVIEPFQVRTQERQLSLTIDLAPDLPPLVSHATRLKRILAELLNNACKYTPPGEAVSLKVTLEAGRFQLSVSNSGVEIPRQELPRIFDKFYRVSGVDVWQQGGVGLGLALVERLVNALGGSIQVECSAAQTCFTVELPLIEQSVT